MTEHEDLFREAFASHEHLAPHMGAVYLGSQVLYRRYQRRRRGAQMVGGTVLGAGLLAAGAHLPASMLPGATLPAPAARVDVTTPPAAAPTLPAGLSAAERARDEQAFVDAGYGYDDAVRLAALWHSTDSVRDIKAEAGILLRAGRTLPIPPHPIHTDPGTDTGPQAPVAAFFKAGYTYDDAVRLARLWKLPDPAQAKAVAGTRLLAGRSLPFPPAGPDPRQRFWDAGYGVPEAEKLARLWHVSIDQAKTEAGRRLLAGKKLPL